MPAAYSLLFGVMMVASAAVGSHGPILLVAAAALLAVAVGAVFRPAATIAVFLSVALIVVSSPSQVLAALSGLCAAAYLVCRHAADEAASWPTIACAVGFTFTGLAATSIPLQVPWLPLVAPLVVLAVYVLAVRPFLITRSGSTKA